MKGKCSKMSFAIGVLFLMILTSINTFGQDNKRSQTITVKKTNYVPYAKQKENEDNITHKRKRVNVESIDPKNTAKISLKNEVDSLKIDTLLYSRKRADIQKIPIMYSETLDENKVSTKKDIKKKTLPASLFQQEIKK